MTRTGWKLVLVLLAIALVLAIVGSRPSRPVVAAPPMGAEPAGLQTLPIHELRRRDLLGGNEYLARNLVAAPIELRCRLAASENISTVPALPRTLVIAPLLEVKVTELRSILVDESSSATIECAAMIGDPRALIRDDVEYALPFHRGTETELAQGFDGQHSHQDEQSRHALDFAVPEGTPILAARDGVVMQFEQDFRKTGTDLRQFGDRANYVRVLHPDGSMALYAHLAPNSVLRRLGERVRVGDLLAKSGNTGFSTGPHLHFAVQRNAGMSLRSIPFRMAGVETSGQP